MHYPGINGFLGTRASIMLDIVFLAMFVVVPTMYWSIWLVRSKRRYTLHKRVQVLLGLTLLVAVTVFEIDMRMNVWSAGAQEAPFSGSLVYPSLYVRLFFAVPTAVLWIFVMVQPLRKCDDPPLPNSYSASHKFW